MPWASLALWAVLSCSSPPTGAGNQREGESGASSCCCTAGVIQGVAMGAFGLQNNPSWSAYGLRAASWTVLYYICDHKPYFCLWLLEGGTGARHLLLWAGYRSDSLAIRGGHNRNLYNTLGILMITIFREIQGVFHVEWHCSWLLGHWVLEPLIFFCLHKPNVCKHLHVLVYLYFSIDWFPSPQSACWFIHP